VSVCPSIRLSVSFISETDGRIFANLLLISVVRSDYLSQRFFNKALAVRSIRTHFLTTDFRITE
jgi:hypothetical protein